MPIGGLGALRQAGRRAHFLGDGAGDVAEALLVFGEDRCSSSRRSSRLVREKVSKALRAALTALSTSAAEPAEMWPATCFVGRIDHVELLGVTGSTHLPSM